MKAAKKTTKPAAVKTAAEIQANVLETFAMHCGCIMTAEHLMGFGVGIPDGPSVVVSMKITSRAEGGNQVWDQVEVNGECAGNRCGARNEYARLCAPVLAAAFALK